MSLYNLRTLALSNVVVGDLANWPFVYRGLLAYALAQSAAVASAVTMLRRAMNEISYRELCASVLGLCALCEGWGVSQSTVHYSTVCTSRTIAYAYNCTVRTLYDELNRHSSCLRLDLSVPHLSSPDSQSPLSSVRKPINLAASNSHSKISPTRMRKSSSLLRQMCDKTQISAT